MKKISLILIVCLYIVQANAQFSIRRNTADGLAVDILYKPATTGTHAAKFFEFSLQVPYNSAKPVTASFLPSTILAAIPSFTAYSAVEAQDVSASYYTFAWAASGGLPNYASTYAFTAGAEVILGTVTFSTAANANTVVVNAVDYQSASTYGGNTTAAIWTMQQDAANTDVTTYGSLFYQSLASGSTPGSDAPLSVGSNPDQKLFLTSTPLPVTLVSFKGSIANCTSVLKWKTSAEYNSNYFGIERSIDGISYSEIARVDSKNSGGGAAYTYTDKSLNAGINYYRLKATDFDGIHKYSEILTLNSDCNYTPIAVWPNPAIDNVTVTGLQGRTKLTLIDAGGKQVATFTTTAINQKINMGRFSRGNYTIAVTAADGTVTTLKLIKI